MKNSSVAKRARNLRGLGAYGDSPSDSLGVSRRLHEDDDDDDDEDDDDESDDEIESDDDEDDDDENDEDDDEVRMVL